MQTLKKLYKINYHTIIRIITINIIFKNHNNKITVLIF